MDTTPNPSHRSVTTLIAIAVVSTSALGCRPGFDDTASHGAPVSLADGLIAGDFGPRRGIDGAATRLEASTDSDAVSSTIHIMREQRGVGVGMVIVALSGLTLNDLAVGEHRFNYDVDTIETQSIFVNVCSGDSDAAFDYDVAAARGVLVVSENNDGLVDVDVHTETLRIEGGVDVTDSSFSFSRKR